MIATDLSLTDRRLLTAVQVAFPLAARPFADLGSVADLSEAQVIARLGAVKEQRIIRRIGPVFEPAAIGLTTELVAVEVDPDRVESVGAAIAKWPQVTHCYLRDHRVNLWFAGAAPILPKLSGVRTSASPKCQYQTRFTNTRDVSGWSGRVSQSASSRRPLPCVIAGCWSPARITGNPLGASSPGML